MTMASKTFLCVVLILAVGLWSGCCDVFVDEDGETEVIPIDDGMDGGEEEKSMKGEPCQEKSHARLKREKEDPDPEEADEEGSGEAYEDDKEASEPVCLNLLSCPAYSIFKRPPNVRTSPTQQK